MRNEYGSCNTCSVCTWIIPCVLIALLFSVVGLLVGSAIAAIIIANLAALVVLAVILVLLLGIWAVVRLCRCRNFN